MKKNEFILSSVFVCFVCLFFVILKAQAQEVCFKYDKTTETVTIIECPTEIIPTNTPTPTLTPTPFVVPTQETFPTPEFTPTPIPSTKVCKLRAGADNINIRNAHSTVETTVVGLWLGGTEQTFVEFYEDRDYLWGRNSVGWSVVYDIPADAFWVYGVEFYSDICSRVPGWPEGLEPPPAFAEWVPPDNPRGIHLFIGANCDKLLTNMQNYGIIKGITGTQECLRDKLYVAYPNKFYIWRNWIRAGHIGDGPYQWGTGDPIEVANDWWSKEYSTWLSMGLIQADRNDYEHDVIDLFEYRNELIFVGDWEIQFDLQMLKLATEHNVCLGAFSDGYGNPTLAQFNQRQPVLEYMLTTECQPGRHHVIATHSYSKYDSGMWYFDRWQTFRATLEDAFGPRYNALYWVFTELGVPNTKGDYDGRGTPDCPKALRELDIVGNIFKLHQEVVGYTIFAMGLSDEWLDWSKCLQ